MWTLYSQIKWLMYQVSSLFMIFQRNVCLFFNCTSPTFLLNFLRLSTAKLQPSTSWTLHNRKNRVIYQSSSISVLFPSSPFFFEDTSPTHFLEFILGFLQVNWTQHFADITKFKQVNDTSNWNLRYAFHDPFLFLIKHIQLCFFTCFVGVLLLSFNASLQEHRVGYWNQAKNFLQKH